MSPRQLESEINSNIRSGVSIYSFLENLPRNTRVRVDYMNGNMWHPSFITISEGNSQTFDIHVEGINIPIVINNIASELYPLIFAPLGTYTNMIQLPQLEIASIPSTRRNRNRI